MGKYLTFISALALALYFMFSSQSLIMKSSARANMIYTDYLTSAVQDAAKKMKETADPDKTMPDPEDRKAISEVFFQSLAQDFGYVTKEDLERLHVYVPALLLIDYDGYYVEYNERSDDLAGTKLTPVISDLLPWTKTDETGHYAVRYTLTDKVYVTDTHTGKTYTGDFLDVADEMEGDPDTGFSSVPVSLRKLGLSDRMDELEKDGTKKGTDDSGDHTRDNTSWFQENRDEIIAGILEEKVNYYINHNNIAAAVYKDYGASYKFTMPKVDNDWGKILKNPTVLGFLQGIRISDSDTFLNIYAFSGGELRKKSAVSMNVSTSSTLLEKTFYLNERSDASGYVPDQADAARSGQMVVRNQDELVPHVHVGSPNDGTGCYGLPVYHNHTNDCYEYDIHRHVDKNGNPTTKTENGISVVQTEVPALLGPGGCYTKPRYHKHTADCYKFTGEFTDNPDYHHHTGSPETGGGCYTVPIYHVHTAECYAKESDQVYQPTKKIYHKHTYPTMYYALMGGDPGEEYTKEEIEAQGLQDDAYVVRADAEDPDVCYREIIYRRPVYEMTGTKTLVVDMSYSIGLHGEVVDKTFTAPISSIYTVKSGVYSKEVSLKKGEKLRIQIGRTTTVTIVSSEETLLTTGERTPESVTIQLKETPKSDKYQETLKNHDYEDGETIEDKETISGADGYYEIEGTVQYVRDEFTTETGGNGKKLVDNGWSYYRMENTCGKSEGDVEREEPVGPPIVSKKKGELICGKTEHTIEGYALGCGKIDLSDLSKNGLYDTAAKDGKISAEYILKHAMEGYSLKCGKTEETIEAYTLSCGIEEGNVTNIRLVCGKNEGDIDHYKLSCGIKEGELISEERQQALEK